jgi:hypothetical protein
MASKFYYEIDGAIGFLIWDTPGFERPDALLNWLKGQNNRDDNLAKRFLKDFARDEHFNAEREILKPLVQGAAAIYVADASRPIRDVDRSEIEVLQRCGFPRIGIINSKNGKGEFLDHWKALMRRDFNHHHEFNGHTATFQDRIKLLKAIQAVIPEWESQLENTVNALRTDWTARLEHTAEGVIEFIKETVGLAEREPVNDRSDEKRAKQAAEDRLKLKIRQKEEELRADIRGKFRHTSERWRMDDVLEWDLFSEDVWRVLGLTKKQLAAMGALIGAITGGIIESHLLWHTLGGITATCATAGAITAWMSAGKAVHVSVPRVGYGPITFLKGGKIGGVKAEARVMTEGNLLWILLDRWLLYSERACSWAHGRREEDPTPVPHDPKTGPTSHWSKEDRGKVGDFVGHLRRKNPDGEKLDKAERALRDLLLKELQAMAGTRGSA